jgi:hypothetical protein
VLAWRCRLWQQLQHPALWLQACCLLQVTLLLQSHLHMHLPLLLLLLLLLLLQAPFSVLLLLLLLAC